MKHEKNDLLRRQDCIEAIEGITCSMSLCVNADECHGMQRMRKQAVIELANMPAVQPDHIADSGRKVSISCAHENDLIFRQMAIEKTEMLYRDARDDASYMLIGYNHALSDMQAILKSLPSAQPEITDEQAIEHLQSTGWMQNHDREIYESGLREQLADDSGSYNSLIPCEDTISRQAAIDAVHVSYDEIFDFKSTGRTIADSVEDIISNLPSAQSERKKGEWMLAEDGWYCSVCELYPPFDCDPEEKGIPYCPNCGAMMLRGKQDG